MAGVYFDITISLDGFVAGPNPNLEHPLGEGGEELHDWVVEPSPGARRTGSKAARERPRPW